MRGLSTSINHAILGAWPSPVVRNHPAMPARPRKTKQHLSVCADALGCLPYRLLPALCLIWGSTCLPTPAQAAPCPWVVTPATSQKLYDILQALPPGDCTLTGQSAGSAQIDQQWQGRQGQLNLPWQARACQAINMNDLEDVRHRGQLEPRSLLPFAQACPLTAALVQKRMGINDFPAAIGPTPAPEPSRPPSPESTVSAQVQGLAAAEVLAIALLLGWLAQTWRRHRRGPTQGWQAQKPWWQAALALFALALCLRFAVTPVPANWYTPVLGRSGLSVEDRYGLADIALQWLLRACLPWQTSAGGEARQYAERLKIAARASARPHPRLRNQRRSDVDSAPVFAHPYAPAACLRPERPLHGSQVYSQLLDHRPHRPRQVDLGGPNS